MRRIPGLEVALTGPAYVYTAPTGATYPIVSTVLVDFDVMEDGVLDGRLEDFSHPACAVHDSLVLAVDSHGNSYVAQVRYVYTRLVELRIDRSSWRDGDH